MAIIHSHAVIPVQQKPDHARYTFNVLDKDGNRKKGLRISFLEVRAVHENDTNVSTQHKGAVTIWPLYCEPMLQHRLRIDKACKCIISFQMFDDGEYFAVARVYKDEVARIKQDTEKGEHHGS